MFFCNETYSDLININRPFELQNATNSSFCAMLWDWARRNTRTFLQTFTPVEALDKSAVWKSYLRASKVHEECLENPFILSKQIQPIRLEIFS